MQDLAARLRDLPIEVFSVPEPDEAWARGALADLSDRALLEVTARAIERPKQSASSSFVLHAPLELVARARLLPSVSPSTRGPARRRIAEIGARYAASGPEADLTDHTYPDAGAAFTDLEAALAAGDPTRADAAIGFLGAAMDPGDLATSLTDVVVPALGAAAHAPILLAGALTSSEGRDMFPRLIRAPIRYLAMDWTRRLTWMRRSPVLAPEQEGLVETLLAAPRVTSTSMSIAPTMLAVEADGLAQRLLAGPTTRLSPAEAERALLRVAAWSMLWDAPAHAPYGWTHCLTLPQAVLTLARVARDPRAAIRVAATHVLGFRAILSSGPVEPRDPPPSCRGATLADASPSEAASLAFHADPDQRPAIMSFLATRAAGHADAHLAKYTLACFDAASRDPEASPLFLAAAAYLGAWWEENPGAP